MGGLSGSLTIIDLMFQKGRSGFIQRIRSCSSFGRRFIFGFGCLGKVVLCLEFFGCVPWLVWYDLRVSKKRFLGRNII